MNEENKKKHEDEIIAEEYMLGQEYYNKLLDKAKEEKEKYD